MSLRLFIFFAGLVLLFLGACSEINDIDQSQPLAQLPAAAVPVDTMIKGAPFSPKAHRVSWDTLTPPRTLPAGKPEVVVAHNNVYPAGTPLSVPITAAELARFVPGENGLLLPQQLDLKSEVIPVTQPVPELAGVPRFKDVAIRDIRYLDIECGLHSSYILDVQEDSRGFLWIGTWGNGVARYDGNTLSYFTEANGLIGNLVENIIEDRNGNLWFATPLGFSKYDGITFTNYYLPKGEQRHDYFKLIEDSQGNIWATLDIGGVLRYDGQTFTHFTEEQGLSSDVVVSLAEDQDGRIWMATRNGATIYDGRVFTHLIPKHDPAAKNITELHVDPQGILWLGTKVGVGRYDGQSLSWFTPREGLGGQHVWAIKGDPQGNIWFGTRRGGLSKYDGTSFTYFTEFEGLSNNEILSLSMDRKGNFWMGTYGGGVNRFSPGSFSHYTKREGLSHNVVNYILEDKDHNLWMATEGSGIIKYDGKVFTNYTTEEGLGSNEVACILEDSRGDLWFGFYGNGISRFDGQFFTNYNTENGLCGDIVHAMEEDRNGHLWIATKKGACKLEIDDNGSPAEFIHYPENESLTGIVFADLMADKTGQIWLSSERGALQYNGTHFIPFTFLTNNDPVALTAISETQNGQIWFGSNEGAWHYDGETAHRISEKDGLSNKQVFSIVEDSRHNLWMSTHKGLNLLIPTPDSKSADTEPTILNFHLEDGLKGEDFRELAACLDGNNQLWWGSGKSVTKLDLDGFYSRTPATPPSIYFTNLFLEDAFLDFAKDPARLTAINKSVQEISFGEAMAFNNYPQDLEVPYDVDHFTFNFVAIDWAAPHELTYQYQLEGLETGWSKPGPETKVDFRSLPFGSYTFKVKAISQAGLSSEVIEFAFEILPPWWRTWWAYLIYAILTLAAIYTSSYFVQRRLKLQHELQLKEEEAQKLLELDRFKSRLYTNLTHEFRTPLTVILGMVEQVRQQPKTYLESGTRLIESNGKNLLRLINQLLDLSKLENKSFKLQFQQNDIVPYLRYLVESFQTYANGENLTLRFFSPVESLIMDFDPEQIKQVMTNLISNAVKFTPSGGDIRIRLSSESEELRIVVTDTGIGIAGEDLPHIFDRFYQVDGSTTREGEGTGIGLAHTQELIKLMGGVISVDSVLQQGTTFTIVLPVTQKAPLVVDTDLVAINKWEGPSMNDNFSTPQTSTLGTSSTSQAPTVLIIEDNPDVVIYLKTCLQEQFQLDVAYNGKIGIEKALKELPDLIISDVMMPEKDGYEVCDTLKTDELTSHIPIILLTAKADATSRIAGLKKGADAYLSKPFNREELVVRLNMMLEKQKRLQHYFAAKYQTDFVDGPLANELEETIQVEDAFILKVRKIVSENYSDEDFALPELCRKVGMSRSQLFRKMKALIDTSPSEFIRAYRLKQAKMLLDTTELNVSEVAWKVGYKNLAHFSRSFQEAYGVPPSSM